MPDASFTPDGGDSTSTESNTAITPSAYFHASTNDMVRVGLGFNTPFGSTIEWPDGYIGREQSTKSTLRTFFITPVVGLKLDRWVPGLSIGGGIDLVPASVDLSRDILFGEVEGSVRLGGSGFGAGGRLGVQYRPKPAPGLAIGAAWRSKVAISFDGTGDFDVDDPALRPALPPDGEIEAEITLPQSVLAGVAYSVANFEIEFNLQWVDWSELDVIAIELPDGSTAEDVRNYKDAFTPRIGLEYAFKQLGLDVRAGYAYDPTPIPDENLTVSLPDIDRHVVSVGASYKLPKGYVDAGLLSVLPGENETAEDPNMPPLKGTFEVSALVFALSYGVTL
jgi:long-chain fatty acid transport protein